MSELGPRARALIDATRSADDPTPVEAARVRGAIDARIAVGAGTVMASAAVVTTTGNAAAAPAAAAVATAAWMKVAAGVVVACAVATGTGVVAMSSSIGGGARTSAPPVASARIAATTAARTPSIAANSAPASAPEEKTHIGAAHIAAPVAANAPVVVPVRPRPALAPAFAPAPSPSAAVAAALGATATAAPVVLDSALDHEIALLSVARSALRDGNPTGALSVLHDAAQRFPGGPLAEDRAAETVFALCALGRTAEAQAEAARFLGDHPRSPHATAVRDSCGGPNGSPNP